MNDTDFEARIARALNVGVDERLGAERPAPPFRADAPARTLTRRPSPHWNRLLLAAACIVAVAVGAFALVTSRGSDDKPVPPSTKSATPTPTPSPTATKTVSLGGAQVALPEGWTATREQNATQEVWCLHPAGKPVPAVCPTIFARVTHFSLGDQIDVDTDGGFYGNPRQYCVPKQPKRTGQYGQRQLGGRQAEWRRFVITCPDGSSTQLEQYVVNTLPGYVLSTSQAAGANEGHFATIAAGTKLPARSASAPLLLNDHAIVRKVETVNGRVQITVQHSVDKTGAMTLYPGAKESSELNTYTIPARYEASAKALKPGDRVVVWTNGVTVSAFQPPLR